MDPEQEATRPVPSDADSTAPSRGAAVPATGPTRPRAWGMSGTMVALIAVLVLGLVAAAAARILPGRSTEPTAVKGPCLPRPSRCGFPDASTTGYRHTGIRLTPYTGPDTIRTPGTVIDGKLITRRLVIRADRVTIRRSEVLIPPADADRDLSAIRVWEDVQGAVIEDVQVDGGGMGIGIELAGIDGVALRTDVSHTVDYFRGNQGTRILDSYGHDATTFSGGHSDGFQSLGAGDLTLTGNTLVLAPGADVNSVVTIGSDFARPVGVRIEGNLLAGGGWTVSLSRGGSGIVLRGNRFVRDYSYGPVRDDAETTWSGNVWDDNGTALAPAS